MVSTQKIPLSDEDTAKMGYTTLAAYAYNIKHQKSDRMYEDTIYNIIKGLQNRIKQLEEHIRILENTH